VNKLKARTRDKIVGTLTETRSISIPKEIIEKSNIDPDSYVKISTDEEGEKVILEPADVRIEVE